MTEADKAIDRLTQVCVDHNRGIIAALERELVAIHELATARELIDDLQAELTELRKGVADGP